MNDEIPKWRTKARLPFSPTIRPGFAGGQGSVPFVYVIGSVALVMLAFYLVRAQHQDWTSWRVLLVLAVSVYFLIRAGAKLALNRINRDDDDDKPEENT